MITRRSVWSETEVQELVQLFVPAADEVGRLQRGDDAECRFFKGFVEEGHYGGRTKPTGTRQGIYAVTPGGAFLASVNTRRPKDVVGMLERALAEWGKLDREARIGAPFVLKDDSRFERFYPTDGLILRCTARDLQAAEQLKESDWKRLAWNQDFAWFRKSEVESMLPEARVGATRQMPEALIQRLACLHLGDFVRGQTPAFREADIRQAELTLEVADVQDGVLHLTLRGQTETARSSEDRGVEWDQGLEFKLLGRATVTAGRFTSFELLAVGERTGKTRYNGRDEATQSQIGIALVLDSDAPRVAPANHWRYGWR